MNQLNLQPPYSNFPEDQNEDNFSCLLSNSQISSVHHLKTQSDFSSYLPSNNRYERLHDENIRLSKEMQELINYVDKLEKQKNNVQRKYQHLEKKIKMERMSHIEQMQKVTRELKERENTLQKILRSRNNKENVRDNESVDTDINQCEYIMHQLGVLENRIQDIYQRMRFGITKQWNIQQFNNYREMLRKQQNKRLQANQHPNTSSKTAVKRINERIKMMDQSVNSSINKTKIELQPTKLRFSELKKKKDRLCEIPFIQAVDVKHEQQYHEDIVKRINRKISSLAENMKKI